LKGSKNKKQQGQRSLKQGGLAYQIDFAAADPDLYILGDVPPYPTDEKIDGHLIVGDGNGDSLIPYAKFNDGTDVKIESLMPEDLYLGQIVPFEIKISVSGLEDAEDGNMQFIAGWSTETTSKGEFGYNKTYGVLAAFVDTGDGAHIDTGNAASVSSFDWNWENDEIQGVFNITGLDDGDEVVVEVWVVIQNEFPSGATGNVHSRLIDARTLTTDDSINTGTQTIPMMKVQDGITDNIEARLGTSSVSDEDLLCL
jgi:hypothetical protein